MKRLDCVDLGENFKNGQKISSKKPLVGLKNELCYKLTPRLN